MIDAISPTAQAQIGPNPNPTTALEILIAAGRQSFFNDTFNGNGRTCGTCHREDGNLTIDAEFMANLPPNDPLFVAEFVPALANNFENPVLMRKLGLILENVDGFGNPGVMRGVPHTLALLPNTLTPAPIDGTNPAVLERTGWSGDGAPGTGTLREFIIGAVTQHYPKSLNRTPGVDFTLPSVAQLDALEAFQKSLGRRQDLVLSGPGALSLKNEIAARGQQIFMTPGNVPGLFVGSNAGAGKCFLCHANAGAGDTVVQIVLGTPTADTNANFNTGVENLPSQPADLVTPPQPNPPDGGFGQHPSVQGRLRASFAILESAIASSSKGGRDNRINQVLALLALSQGDMVN
jgi:cytochrome c553